MLSKYLGGANIDRIIFVRVITKRRMFVFANTVIIVIGRTTTVVNAVDRLAAGGVLKRLFLALSLLSPTGNKLSYRHLQGKKIYQKKD